MKTRIIGWMIRISNRTLKFYSHFYVKVKDFKYNFFIFTNKHTTTYGTPLSKKIKTNMN